MEDGIKLFLVLPNFLKYTFLSLPLIIFINPITRQLPLLKIESPLFHFFIESLLSIATLGWLIGLLRTLFFGSIVDFSFMKSEGTMIILIAYSWVSFLLLFTKLHLQLFEGNFKHRLITCPNCGGDGKKWTDWTYHENSTGCSSTPPHTYGCQECGGGGSTIHGRKEVKLGSGTIVIRKGKPNGY